MCCIFFRVLGLLVSHSIHIYYLVVDFASSININDLKPNLRVALRSDSYQIHSILPTKSDPLVALMMVEKVPDSTYEMVGGLEKQIKEIKEVIELPYVFPSCPL